MSFVTILHGSGIRYKILEALACDLPIVSTTLGAQGVQVKHGESIMIADNPCDFAQAIVTLLHNPKMRKTLARNGHKILHDEYTTIVNSRRIWQLVNELCHT